jgi:hypothetical protein
VGVVYDPKVSSFLRYIGQDLFVDLQELTTEELTGMIDQAASRRSQASELGAAVDRLLSIEHGNTETARRLMERSSAKN